MIQLIVNAFIEKEKTEAVVEAAVTDVTENPRAHLHLYGKLEAKHNRKMGHVTLFSDALDEVEEFGKGIDF